MGKGKIIQTVKFHLLYQERDDMDYKQLKERIFELQDQIRTLKNHGSSLYFAEYCQKNEFFEEYGVWLDEKSRKPSGKKKGFQLQLYHSFGEGIPYLNTGCRDSICRGLKQYFEGNGGTRVRDIYAGRAAIPSFGKNQPIEFRASTIQLTEDGNGNYFIRLSIFSKEGVKVFGLQSGMVDFKIWHRSEGGVEIVRRCVSGEYQHRTGSMQYDRRKGMFEFALQFEMDKPELNLDPDKVLGIDLGVAIPAAMAIHGSEKRWFIRGAEISEFRRKVEARRREMQRARPFAGAGSVGHGRNTRARPVDKIGEKVANFRETKNDAYSREIVDIAVKNGCGTIQMEDLAGITAGKQPKFLKGWTYYDLGLKIRYKAADKGINVVEVDPHYTSQRCSKCGYIDRANRPKEEMGQAYFKCVKCGYSANADYNAARNIATPGIEDIIKQQCEAQAAMKN